jgi:hypothetical protein
VVDQRLHEQLVAEDTAVDDLVGHGRRHDVMSALGAGARLDLRLPHDVLGRLDVELLGRRLEADTLGFALAVRTRALGVGHQPHVGSKRCQLFSTKTRLRSWPRTRYCQCEVYLLHGGSFALGGSVSWQT